ncbi:Gfo/Idh/MocA family protein [Maribacter algicola]|uniref:Gfo/Idh/MocA family protein n=1 Tax=Meishania litoralis TaxID=3434685 RepID=A0ACC7LLE9_9FLAO
MDSIRWGILGPGKIAHSFAKDLKLVEWGELTAVGSRDIERAKTFAQAFGASEYFGSYEELLDSNNVDVIYIATPHTGHAEWAIKAMEKGKHVLCEKPMGVNGAEVRRMIKTATENNVFLMEALWSRFNPTIIEVKKLIDEGQIGTLGYLNADFAFYAMDRDEKGRVLNPELAGGSLLDIGIYPVFLSYLMLGNPEKIQASSKFHSTGAEIQTSIIFEYKNAQAVLYSGFTSKSSMRAELSGSKGTLYINPCWHEAESYSIEKNDEIKCYDVPKIGKGYSHEIIEVHKCIRNGGLQSDLWNHQNSLDLIDLLDAVRSKTGITFPFDT